VDDVPVWSISCFYVHKGYHKRGITSVLIAAAVDAAKRAGAPALEAYPLDADLTPSASGTGYASTFERAGSEVVARHVPPRPIIRIMNSLLMVAAISATHLLARQETVPLRMLADGPFLLIEKETMSYELAIRACEQSGFEPKVVYTDHRLENFSTWLARGWALPC
jgi:GNAT superfamily N-acetyltransferase